MGATYYRLFEWIICSWPSFNSKSDLQEVAKIYSIKSHKEFVVVASLKKLLVLRCKKTEECQCLWKLRAMVVKNTCLFVINKYKGKHTYVNLCLNRDHHQLDSNLVAAHIFTIHIVYGCYSSKCDGEMGI